MCVPENDEAPKCVIPTEKCMRPFQKAVMRADIGDFRGEFV